MRLLPPLAAAALVSALAGCAGHAPSPTPAPAISALEAERAAHPTDQETLFRLGRAYYDAREFNRARDVFRGALALAPSFRARVYLGLSWEGLDQPDSARAAYTAAAALARTGRERDELAARAAALSRQALLANARLAVANEARLGAAPGSPNTIAVLPWQYAGANADLRPLGRGIAQLLVTDLSRIGSLRLLERAQAQALLDELALGRTGRVDSATAARSGRLLRAGRVVQGALTQLPAGDQLRMDADVVNAGTAAIVATGSATDRLQQLFAMEKTVLFELLRRMGITPTPAEQRALSERPTADLQAFLAYSRGLAAEDRGDFSRAAREFRDAVRRDPSFGAAAAALQSSGQAAAGAALTPATIATLVTGGPVTPGLGNAARALTLRTALQSVVPSMSQLLLPPTGPGSTSRTGLPEATRQDDPRTAGAFGQVIITVDRP